MFAKLTAPACPVIAGCLLVVWAVTDHARAQSAWPKSPATENAKPAMPAKPAPVRDPQLWAIRSGVAPLRTTHPIAKSSRPALSAAFITR
jgi:hypothetical protein